MFLMNGDKQVLEFSLEDMYLKVLDNNFLPYELKDFVKTSNPTDIKKMMKDLEIFKDFLSSRVLLLSRENAKVILNVTSLPQSLKTEDRIKIVLACKGLNMTDNFWIKEDGEHLSFADVNLRKNKLSDASYEIAILGKHISATAEDLRPDLSTIGMFPKYWKREGDSVYLYKTDKLGGKVNSAAEIEASRILKEIGADVVPYKEVIKDGILFSVSKCIATDECSLVSASSVKDWCVHTGKDFLEFVKENYMGSFSNMVVSDFILANTDRHMENWGFIVDNRTNRILSFAPLYDLNQALVADKFGTDVRNLIYEPTEISFLEGIKEYASHSTLDLTKINIEKLSSQVKERLDTVLLYRYQKSFTFNEIEEIEADER